MKKLFTLIIALLSIFSVQSARGADVVFNVTVPTPTNQVWIVGNFQGWNPAAMIQGVKVDDTHYKVTLNDATFAQGITLANLEYGSTVILMDKDLSLREKIVLHF